MISDIRIDFTALKRIILSVINQNEPLISSSEENIFNELYKNYRPKIIIEKRKFSSCKKLFSDYYREKCRKISAYCTDDNEDNRVEISSLENDGKLFSSSILVSMNKQLKLEQALSGEDNHTAICIIECLHAHLGNMYYYLMDDEKLVSLFQNAVYLYLSDTRRWATRDMEMVSIIKSMKNLLSRYSLEYEINYGEIILSDKSDRTIQSDLEQSIRMIGGIAFLGKLFVRNISQLYDNTVDRYLINRNKRQYALRIDELRIPFNYLIQLGIKYVNHSKVVMLTDSGTECLFDTIIQNSRDYLNVMNLQSYSVFSDLIYDYKTIPMILKNNTIFEKMFTPLQYRPDFVIEFLKEVYAPLSQSIIIAGYSFDEYLQFCRIVLENRRVCVKYSFDELKQKTEIGKKALMSILSDVSFEYDEVNSMFDTFLSETNYNLKPLVRLSDGTYFLFSTYFNGFAFCEAIYHKLKPLYHKPFDKDKGRIIESMVRSFFDSKKYPYHYGNYKVSKSQTEDCDLVVENDDKIVFIEIKNRPLDESFEQGDDVTTLKCLAEGMIYAQRQCLKHEYYLKKFASITLESPDKSIDITPYKLSWNNRRVIRVSVCSQEYLFLTNKLFSAKLLESLTVSTYHANDEKREDKLDKLNGESTKLRDLIYKMYGPDTDLNQIFYDTLLRSAQQIYTILSVSHSLDEFINYLTQPIYFEDGSGDVYCQLLHSINMANCK